MSISDKVKAQLQTRAAQLVQKYDLRKRVSKRDRRRIARNHAEIEEINNKLGRKFFGAVDGQGNRASLYQKIRDLENEITRLGGEGAVKMSPKESREWSEADD